MNLDEFSKLLDLSRTTVSRALNGFPEVNEDTRRRVEEAAILHNYRPNFRGKILATGRSLSIGHIVPLSTRNDIVNPVFSDLIASTGETFSRRGYSITLSVVKDKDQHQAYLDMIRNGSVDGLIVHGIRKDDPRIEWLRSNRIPYVVHGRDEDAPTDYSWVDVNNKSAFNNATKFLVKLGHKRIALINGNEAMDFAARRKKGYQEALQDHGIPFDPTLTSSDHMIESHGYLQALEMFKVSNPPTAFLVSSILLAIGVRRAIQEKGLELGKDVSIVTHDDDLSFLPNTGDIPMFTATRSSIRMAGHYCAEMLIDQIEGKTTTPQNTICKVELVLGASTGPPRT